MQFSENSGTMIKSLIPKLKRHIAYRNKSRDSKFNKSLDGLLLLLYNEIHSGANYVKNRMGTKCLQPIINKKGKHVKYNSQYFSEEIQEYINAHMKHQLLYKCDIEGREITVIFGILGEAELENLEKYDQYAKFIYSWLYVCYKFSLGRCSKTLDIYLYLTPIVKVFPQDTTKILGSSEVNTAFTYNCQSAGEIFIYREEEWKKVFIHETFHTFGFDFNKNEARNLYNYVGNIFPIESAFNVEEAYVETWARIIHAGYESYASLKNRSDTAEFLLYFRFSLQMERLFSLQQMHNVLHYMGIDYNLLCSLDLQEKQAAAPLYRENSNVFAYYVLSGILMNDYYGFLLWCSKHNSTLFRFNASSTGVKSFIEFIKGGYRAHNLLRVLDTVKKQSLSHKTLRMSVTETASYL